MLTQEWPLQTTKYTKNLCQQKGWTEPDIVKFYNIRSRNGAGLTTRSLHKAVGCIYVSYNRALAAGPEVVTAASTE